MVDKIKISQLDSLTRIDDNDVVPAVDTSTQETVKVSVSALKQHIIDDVNDVVDKNTQNIQSLEQELTSKIDDAYVEDGYLILTANGNEVTRLTGFGGTGGGGGGGSSGNNAVMTIANNTEWLSKTIAPNSDCFITFSWSSLENDLQTGSGTLTITVNGIIKTNRNVNQGQIKYNLKDILDSGMNKVRVSISDVYGNIKSIMYTVTLASITIESTFDSTVAYNSAITFPFTPNGALEKTVIFKIDDVEVDRFVTSRSGRQEVIDLPKQSHGAHKLEVYFNCEIDGEEIESNHLIYTLICIEQGDEAPIIAIDNLNTNVQQYQTLSIGYIVYSPNQLSTTIKLIENNKVLNTITVDRTKQIWSYRPDVVGNVTLKIETLSGESKSIPLSVSESEINISPETSNLALYLSSYGRSNGESQPNTWIFEDINTTFTNFNFVSDGWQKDDDNITVLRVSGDARLRIPYKIFAKDFRTTGKTIELEFATRDVMNYDTTILSCVSGGKGITLTPQEAKLTSAQSSISTQYKEDEHTRISFVVEKRNQNRLLQCYINGILSGVVQYPSDDDFSQATPVDISIGSNDCTVDLYCIRVYDNNLNRYQIVDNWIFDTQNGYDKLNRYLENDIYDEYGKIVINKLPDKLPYMVLEGSTLPQYKGDKKTISGYYVDPKNPNKSFSFQNASIDVQGTSSQYYARKNYKIKFSNGFTMTSSNQKVDKYAVGEKSIPVNTFTFKADVASSEGANNVELVDLYEDFCPFKTKPQKTNDKVRQGIEGYPMVMFWNNGGTITFLGKYNFNNDKGTPEVFGFSSGDESWETLDNTLALTQFKTNDWSDWVSSYEARYPEDNENITRLRQLSDWIYSTDTTASTNRDLSSSVQIGGKTYTKDSAEYRLAKFKNEIGNYFDLNDLIYYYVFTELFLMIDSRVKNSFPTKFGDDKWCFLPYDMDTAIGINNEGTLTFSYNLEDIDKTETGADVYNGQESVLWNNVRQCFQPEIKQMYQTIRSNGLTYDEVENRFTRHQSYWSPSIFNEDAYYKYIEPLINNNDGAYLGMCQGSKESQRKWWLYNRFRYIDSKYTTGYAQDSYINFRAYANGDFEITPYADIYARVQAGSLTDSVRAKRGQTYTLHVDRGDANDTECMIFSADQLKYIGDLSVFKVGYCNIASATKLQELKIGSSTVNQNLTSLTLGNNILLKKIDVRNCPNLKSTIDASGCSNIEEVYFEGSGITGLQLPNGGILKKLHLPNTITNLTLLNQSQLNEFTITNNDYSNITTLRIENTPFVDALSLLNKIPASSRVRIIGFTKNVSNTSEISSFYDKLDTMRGLDENGNNTDKPQMSGTINIDNINGTDYANLSNRYPTIKINYNNITATVYFYDGSTLLGTRSSTNGSAVTYPNPTKSSTVSTTYTFTGWSTKEGGNVVQDALTNIQGDKRLYAVWKETLREYNVSYYNGTTLIKTVTVPYGKNPANYYNGTRPVYNGTEEFGEFIGWDETVVTGNMSVSAQFLDLRSVTRRMLEDNLDSYTSQTLNYVGKYAFADSKIKSVDLPNATSVYDNAFDNTKRLVSANLPNVVTIGDHSFYGSTLSSITAPSLTTVKASSFLYARQLTSIDFPELTTTNDSSFAISGIESVNLPNLKIIGYQTFTQCSRLKLIDLPKVTSINGHAFSSITGMTIIIRTDEVCTLKSTNAIPSDAKIYVPSALLSSYKTATNWSTMADRIFAIEGSEFE